MITNKKTHQKELDMKLADAAWHGMKPEVERLLKQGASPNARNEFGLPALMDALDNGHTNVVRLLLEYGADANSREDHSGDTALMSAAYNGNMRAVKLLIKYGADVAAKNNSEATALYYARNNDYENVAAFLEPLINYGERMDKVNDALKRLKRGKAGE